MFDADEAELSPVILPASIEPPSDDFAISTAVKMLILQFNGKLRANRKKTAYLKSKKAGEKAIKR